MNDPAELSSDAQSLISQGKLGLDPDESDRTRMREKLAGLVALSATSATSATAAAAAGKLGTSALAGASFKFIALIVAVGAVGGVALYRNYSRPENHERLPVSAPRGAAPMVAPPSAPMPAATANVVVSDAEEGLIPESAARPRVPQPTKNAEVTNGVSIALEVSAIAGIERALRARDYEDVRARVQSFRERFPHGQLLEENDALAAIALCSEGGPAAQNSGRARTLSAFRRRYPGSLMLQQVIVSCSVE